MIWNSRKSGQVCLSASFTKYGAYYCGYHGHKQSGKYHASDNVGIDITLLKITLLGFLTLDAKGGAHGTEHYLPKAGFLRLIFVAHSVLLVYLA